MNTGKQVQELTPEDLRQSPVWQFAPDEMDNDFADTTGGATEEATTVHPYETEGALDPAAGRFIVQATFTLADGTELDGYLSPLESGDLTLANLQPTVVTDSGQIMFWFGLVEPPPEYIAASYALLDRSAAGVFPVEFRSKVPLVNGDITGQLPGFLVLEVMNPGAVKVIQ